MGLLDFSGPGPKRLTEMLEALVPLPAGSDDRGPPGVLASAATGMVDYIARMGGDVDRIFGDAHLIPDLAGSPTVKLRLADFCRLFEEAARQTKHGNFGLWFGNQFQPRDLGYWGYAAVASPTLASALGNLVGLFAYHQECSRMNLVLGSDGLMRLEYQIEASDIVDRRQDAELSLGMFLNVIRECCGRSWAPEEVHFEHPRPAEAKEHERAFDAPVYFSQPCNALLFRPTVLSRAMPHGDVRLMDLMRMSLVELRERKSVAGSLLDRVCTAIRVKLPNGTPSLEEVASELRISSMALSRELADNNVSFKELLEGTRRELARSYIRERQLPLSEIALLLGYSELSAFSRAFRRWTGRSPRSYRAAGHDPH